MLRKKTLFVSILLVVCLIVSVKYSNYFNLVFNSTQKVENLNQDLIVVINAGSSGTRGHLFSINKDSINIAEISPPALKKPGISDYVNKKTELLDYIKNIISELKSSIKNYNNKYNIDYNSKNIDLYFMATAGMRYVEQNNPEQASETYKILSTEINKDFNLKYIGTISGEDEGLYDWISVNYLLNKYNKYKINFTTLDMGGASTQVSYLKESSDINILNNLDVAKIKNIRKDLFIHSFLGLGYNQAIETLQQSESCNNKYNFTKCLEAANNLIDKHKVKDIAGDLHQKNIVAFDHIYKVFKYFNIENANNPILELNNILNSKCQNDNNRECLGAIYISRLLQYGYNIDINVDKTQLIIIKEINNLPMDWSIGAGLYNYNK